MAKAGRRARFWIVLGGAVVLGVPLVAYGALLALVRSDAVRPRLQAAVEAATGRAFALSGPVGLRPSLVPVITLEGPSLANAPGGSRPEMLRARRIEAAVELLPLLSRQVRVTRIALVEPDLLLEVDEAGRPNWVFGPAARPETTAPASPAAPPSRPLALDVSEVTVEGGRVTWRAGGREEVVALPRLVLRGDARGTAAEGRIAARGAEAALSGTGGPLAALLAGAAGDWPFAAKASLPGVEAEASGALSLPVRAGGWRARLAGRAEEASRLAAFLPGVALPPARGIAAEAEVEGGTPRSIAVSVQEVALGGGAVAGPLRIGAAGVEAPVTLAGTLRLGSLPLEMEATGPSLSGMAAGGPVAAALRGEGLAVSARGSVTAGRVEGTEWRVEASAADLRAVGARAGYPGLPALHDLSVAGIVRPGAAGAELHDLAVEAREVSGRVTAVLEGGAAPRAVVRAGLRRLDLDAALAPPPAAAPGDAPRDAPPPAQAAPDPAPAGGRPDGRVIPDRPIDLRAIREARAAVDVEASVATLRARGADWRDVSLRAVLADRKLVVERLAATTPGGAVSGRLSAEADGAVPRLSAAIRSGAGGLDLGALAGVFDARFPVSGPAAVDLDLRGEGAGMRAVAASLSGHAGLAMTGGRIDPRLLSGVTSALRGAVPEAGAATEIRCLALRFDVAAGVARSRALVVQAGPATASGGGAANLGDETLAFRLQPVVRVGDVSLTTPLGVTGRFAAPRVSMDPNAAAAAAAGVLGGLGRRAGDGDAAALGAIAEELLGRRGGGTPAVDCAGALAVARGEAPAVGSAPAPEAPRAERRPQVQDLLRGLLGR